MSELETFVQGDLIVRESNAGSYKRVVRSERVVDGEFVLVDHDGLGDVVVCVDNRFWILDIERVCEWIRENIEAVSE